MVGRVASSGQRPSFKPFRLFDEKRAALPFLRPFGTFGTLAKLAPLAPFSALASIARLASIAPAALACRPALHALAAPAPLSTGGAR